MFIGHFAVGFAGKKFAPRSSVATLLVAALFLDVLWPIFLLLGWEHVRIEPGNTRFTPFDLWDYPWSHSLLMSIAWATLFAFAYHLLTRYREGAVVIWIAVLSHWVLDWITHRPDMPLYPGPSPRFGLGLWNSISGTMVTEISMLALAVWLYAHTTSARDRIGRYAFGVYVLLLLILYVGDGFSGPPNSTDEIIWPGIVGLLLLTIWAWWFDRHRVANPAPKE